MTEILQFGSMAEASAYSVEERVKSTLKGSFDDWSDLSVKNLNVSFKDAADPMSLTVQSICST